MAALTADRLLKTYQLIQHPDGMYLDYPVAASTVIYDGGFVGLNTSGYLVMYAPPTVGTSIVGGHRLMGVACEHIASQSSNGAKNCSVMVRGRIQGTVSTTTVADIGKPVFATTSNPADCSFSCLGNAFIGHLANFISGDECVIEFDPQKYLGGQPLSVWSSPIIASAAANIVTMVPKSANPNGLIVAAAYGITTTDFGAAVVYTLQDTAATTLGITFTGSTASDAGEVMVTTDTSGSMTPLKLAVAATDLAVTIVPAGLGVDIKVTTTSATGAAKFFIYTHPVA